MPQFKSPGWKSEVLCELALNLLNVIPLPDLVRIAGVLATSPAIALVEQQGSLVLDSYPDSRPRDVL